MQGAKIAFLPPKLHDLMWVWLHWLSVHWCSSTETFQERQKMEIFTAWEQWAGSWGSLQVVEDKSPRGPAW